MSSCSFISKNSPGKVTLSQYAEKYGVTKATIKYKTNRQYIYSWKRRYDGSIHSLRDRSCRPYHHPNQHTAQEIKLITDMCRRNPHASLVWTYVNTLNKKSRKIMLLSLVPHPPFAGVLYNQSHCVFFFGYISPLCIQKLLCTLPLHLDRYADRFLPFSARNGTTPCRHCHMDSPYG